MKNVVRQHRAELGGGIRPRFVENFVQGSNASKSSRSDLSDELKIFARAPVSEHALEPSRSMSASAFPNSVELIGNWTITNQLH